MNLRVAGNLSAHSNLNTDTRGAIWLTPSAVKGFKADDFRELETAQQATLLDAVQDFERVAKLVPPDAMATNQQFREANVALEKIRTILNDYLPRHEAATRIQNLSRTRSAGRTRPSRNTCIMGKIGTMVNDKAGKKISILLGGKLK